MGYEAAGNADDNILEEWASLQVKIATYSEFYNVVYVFLKITTLCKIAQ